MALRNPINREVVRLAVPSILANITVPLVGLVDTAVSGHLGDASLIGGIAIGTMLFDLLYWNMGFLRVGTGGITAQAYGRGDRKAAIGTFSQGIATALAVSLLLLVLQWGFVELMLRLVPCSPEVGQVARQYFYIRIWAAPATLSLFVFKGWFIGMQNTVFPLITDLWVNLANMLASWLLSFYTPLGIKGIAYGTLIAQWTGLLLVVVYEGFTILAARFGDVELAVSSVMMHLFMLFSYFVDGFAYAGEAMTGRFIGERNAPALRQTVKYVFLWGAVIGLLFTLLYAVFPRTVIGLLTDNAEVITASGPYLPWLLLMPLLSCAAFIWDGIYIGATAARQLMLCMIWAAALFLATFFLCEPHFGPQALYIAYFTNQAVRSLYLTFSWKKIRNLAK